MKAAVIPTIILVMWLVLGGCMVIWTDDVFIGTMFKAVDANDIELIAEPNYLQIGSGVSKTTNDKIRVITPGVGVKVGD